MIHSFSRNFQDYKFGDISKEAAKRAKSAMANLLGQVPRGLVSGGVVRGWGGKVPELGPAVFFGHPKNPDPSYGNTRPS